MLLERSVIVAETRGRNKNSESKYINPLATLFVLPKSNSKDRKKRLLLSWSESISDKTAHSKGCHLSDTLQLQ